MPRRNRRLAEGAGDDDGELPAVDLRDRILGPVSARMEGFEVRTVVNRMKSYRCPYCEGSIVPGTSHTVAVPTGAADARRHYHSGCWVKQVRGSGPAARGASRW